MVVQRKKGGAWWGDERKPRSILRGGLSCSRVPTGEVDGLGRGTKAPKTNLRKYIHQWVRKK